MLELMARLTCDRCDREVMLEDVENYDDASERSCQGGWGSSEDGEDVCPECWSAWDAEHVEGASKCRIP